MTHVGASDHLAWRNIRVEGRQVRYGVGGHGLPVLFMHGWGLDGHSYRRALKRLVRMGCRVYAPSMPGFGGSAGLPAGHRDLAEFAAWTAAFLEAVGVEEPVLAVGHSFGGAVATKLAHDFPERVGHLVLVNAVGSAVWSGSGGKVRAMADRPLWHWAIHFPWDMAREGQPVALLRAVLECGVPNVISNPLEVARAAWAAKKADLSADLAEMCAAGMPVAVLWGEGDSIVPRACFDDFCGTTGRQGVLVAGRHCWLLADPDSFGQAMAGPVRAASAERAARAGLAASRMRQFGRAISA